MTSDLRPLSVARLRLASSRPYYASALYRMTAYPAPGLGTMAVDRHWRLAVDPAVFTRWTVAETAAVLEHELGHLLRDHATRADSLGVTSHTALRFNIAADAEINDDLVASKSPLPDGAVTPASLGLPDGQLAEWYYEQLADSPHSGSAGQPGRPDCGSGAHGHAREWESSADAIPRIGQVEADAIRRATAQAIRAHGTHRGDVPAGLARWATSILEPTLPWPRLLAQEIRRSIGTAQGMVDYSYRRPSRRAHVLPQVVTPSMVRPTPEVAVVIDTSGSMPDEYLGLALTETSSIMRATGVSAVTVVECDARAVVSRRRPADLAHTPLTGGGGTDMCVGIEAAHTARPRPTVVVVFTDGFTPWPSQVPPGIAHIVVVIGSSLSATLPIPDWASPVVVDIPASPVPEPF